MWVFPGEMNILDSGYAGLDTLFFIAPWVFLFLVPAVTMKLFAEEKQNGTLDLLLTRPLYDIQIIIAKYLAGLSLVMLSLIPTLVYYYTVVQLQNTPGSLDTGATWGSYLGLFLLAAIYTAIGLFASSLTKNQVVAFIISLFICFIIYTGFDYLGFLFSGIEQVVISFGINEHYKSISRGVIDSRDLIYFLSIIMVFVFATRTALQSRRW
jgi:ABC-2 type transport system permease protein